jgi:predicted nucleic acid-binding protein
VKLVVDASVAIKWFVGSVNEERICQADAVVAAIQESDTELLAPAHWTAEVIAVLARRDPRLVDDALLAFDEMNPELIHSVAVMRRAADMAIALEHHLFDTLYHAVALEEGATLVTADEVYFRKAQSLGAIQLLGTFAPPA